MIKRFLFAATMLLFANILLAYDFSAVSNGTTFYYYITSNNSPYTVEVTIGAGYSGNVTIPSSVTYNDRTYSVTSIGNSAFAYCTSLTSVTIPNSVTSIGNWAFSFTGLTRTNYTGTIAQWCNIDFDGFEANPLSYSRNLYINNQLITNLVIPNTVDTIKQYVFASDTCITSVTIPNSVTSIGYGAFYNCTGLTSVTIPNSVTSIGNYAFAYCTSLTSVTIPNSVTSIGGGVFGGCTGLTSVTIPNSVTSIGQGAFGNCTGLTSITIPNSVTSIGNDAFNGCTGLTSITIPNSVTSIGDGAFYNCTGLTSVTIPSSVTSIGDFAFVGCSRLTSVTIPNSVTSIGYGAFYNCTGLTSVTIPSSVTSIGDFAFGGCTGLTRTNYTGTIAQWCNIDFDGFEANPLSYSRNLYINNQLITNLVIPNTVDTIKQYVFASDTCITSVTISNSVTGIGDSAFSGCTGLTSITFRRANTTIGYNNFNGLPVGLPIHIPCGSSAWYINKLPNFSNFIEELQYSYSVTSQDTVKGTVATVTTPTCNSSSWTIRATANNGYTFSHWSDGDTNTQRTLTVNRDTTLVAYFVSVQPWYSFSVVSEDTLKGTVQIITQPSQANPQATFVAVPNTGYTFSRWSDGDTNTQRTLTVNRDTALIAYFVSVPWYTFSVVSEDTLKGTVQIITQPSQANPQATFVALPNTGYTFSRWSDGNTQNPRTLAVTQDTALVAYFTANTPQWYSFSVVSEDTLKGSVQIITQPSQANPQATFVALPNTGYTFSRWSDGNTQNPRTLTVTQDTALVAYFTANTPQWYSFSVVSEDTLKGTVQIITQPSQANPQATFIALPNTGYTFSRWSDGNTQNPRSITVTQDTILIAFFTSNQGIVEAENASIKLYPNPASDKVTLEGIGNEVNILVINAMGKVVRRYENVGGTVTFSVGVLPKGIYFVRMGNAVRKLVVE